MIAERDKINAQLKIIESKLQQYPDGKLICARNATRYKWYQSYGHTRNYIPKKNRQLAEQLAAKKYLSTLYQDLTNEKDAIDAYLKTFHSSPPKAQLLLTENSEYKNLLAPFFKPISEELSVWANSPYNSNPKYPEKRIYKTSSGHFVRSKSEVLIDMALHRHNLPFRYEDSLHLGDATFYPDFTIRHPLTCEFYYWDHFGRMDDNQYAKNTYSKLQFYTAHGIIPSINLITTFETKDHPLLPDTIENLIEQYFL